MQRHERYLACDFETTVYDGKTEQSATEVWSAASVELYTETVHVQHSIAEFFDYLFGLKDNLICYFHNLKFDGSFIIPYLLKIGFRQAFTEELTILPKREMPNKSFNYSINLMGSWYWIRIKYNHKYIEIRDSLKLLPYSLKEIGRSFGTKHQKLTMNYKGFRYAGCPISDGELEYIKNDVLVLKEALEIMFNDGHKKLTIGSCCLEEFKNTLMFKSDWDMLFPDVYQMALTPNFGYDTVGDYIHKSYHGGWCYFCPDKINQVLGYGCTNDVNSLYPSMMHSQSGNRYPVGKPTMWSGNYIPEKAIDDKHYFFVRVRTRFKLKEGRLPCIQIKNNKLYKSTEWLTTSDVLWDGFYWKYILDKDGNKTPTTVELVLTQTDYQLILDQYDLEDFEILDGCYFSAQIGIFDSYIDKYKYQKMRSKGAKRQQAKLFLNNLYGKMAASTDSSYKVCYIGEDGVMKFKFVTANDKTPGYIPIGSAITSYARNFTIRAAQENYHPGEPGFCYADTDSIHCNIPPEEVKGIKCDPAEFCCWKTESCWDTAIFTRQKTYCEHIIKEDLEDCTPYWNVKAAGMPAKSNMIFTLSLDRYESREKFIEDHEHLIEEFDFSDSDIDYIMSGKNITDFKTGLTVPGALKQRRIAGGVVLMDKEYVMRRG